TIERAARDIDELSLQNLDERAELDQFTQTANAHAAVDALDDAVDALRKRMIAAGIAVDADTHDVHTIRSWRATLEVQQAEKQRQAERLSALAKDVVPLPDLRARLDKLRAEIREKELILGNANKRLVTAEKAVRDVGTALAEVAKKRDQA